MVVGRRGLRVGACLSLTGRHSRFGGQAAAGLQAWRVLDGDAELVVEDDGSDPARVESCLRAVAGRCDLLLGPYSTQLMWVASRVAPDLEHLVWNHGGSGDDVAAADPGHMVSVLSPTSRYAEPFVRHLAGQSPRAPLWLARAVGASAGRSSLVRPRWPRHLGCARCALARPMSCPPITSRGCGTYFAPVPLKKTLRESGCPRAGIPRSSPTSRCPSVTSTGCFGCPRAPSGSVRRSCGRSRIWLTEPCG
jgi:hypothetical protein